MIGIIFCGIIILTYGLPWVKVTEEWYMPGQLVIPYFKYFLTQMNILKQTPDSPPTIGDVFVYEKSLRFLSAPPEEGGPHNQITFELIAYAMIAVVLILLIPLKITKIIGFLLSLGSSGAFLLAMLFLERKTIDALSFGLFSNIVCSFVFLVATFFIF